MKLDRIELAGWMCFGSEVRLDLPAGPIAIVARYREDATRSNWAGKTALLEAIRWALLGTHRKRTDDAIITKGADRAVVRLTFDDDLLVERSRRRGGPTLVSCSGPPGSPAFHGDAAQAEIARRIRLSAEDFESTTWFGQGDTEALVGQSSGPRRLVVARWLDLSIWESAGKRAGKLLAAQRQRVLVARAGADAIPAQQASADDESLQVLEQELVEHRAAIMEVEAYLQTYTTHRQALATVDAVRAELREASARAKAAKDAASAAAEGVLDSDELDRLTANLRLARDDLAIVKRKAEEAQALATKGFDGRCPVTREECLARDAVAGRLGTFAETAKAAKEQASIADEKVVAADSLVRGAADAERRATAARVRLDEAIRATHAINERLGRLDAQLRTGAGSEVTDEQAKEWREDLAKLAALRDRLQVDVGARRNAVRTEQENSKRRAAAAAATVAAEQDARAALLTARALGPAGIPARIAAEQLRVLEERANALLTGSGLSFSLSWQRELADAATECRECGREYEKRERAKECPSCGAVRGRRQADELDILVDDGSGEVEDARVKSGGAKVLVAAAIRLAGGVMLRERRGSPFAIAVVDEPFGSLDQRNRAELARTFAAMLGSVGLEQAFVVSHDEALLSALPSKIVIMRDGKRSSAEVV